MIRSDDHQMSSPLLRRASRPNGHFSFLHDSGAIVFANGQKQLKSQMDFSYSDRELLRYEI